MWHQDESGRVHTPFEPVVLAATLALIPVLIIEAEVVIDPSPVLSARAPTGTERVQTGSCGALQRAAETAPIAWHRAAFAVRCIASQLVRGDKMSDDAEFILGFG
jgi:hypothetical protein